MEKDHQPAASDHVNKRYLEGTQGIMGLSKLQAKVKLISYKPDNCWQHVIITDQARCQQCPTKSCLTICPTGVFTWNYVNGDPIQIFYKQCLECGVCRLICPVNNIDFSYPHGGFGVMFREG